MANESTLNQNQKVGEIIIKSQYLCYNTFNSTSQASLQCSPREVV